MICQFCGKKMTELRLGFYVIFSLSLAHGSGIQKFPQDFSEQGLQDESDNML